MYYKVFVMIVLTSLFAACTHKHNEVEEHNVHEKMQFTAYSNAFELFAEADPLIAGTTSTILAHFTKLIDFKALDSSTVSLKILIEGKEVYQCIGKPTHKGIYSFNIKPETTGTGKMVFSIDNNQGRFEITIPQVTVYKTDEEADEAVEASELPTTNTTAFTKEQSWKTNFRTDHPKIQPFGQVIKTTALVQSAQGNEIIISAKTSGMVIFPTEYVLDGKSVSKNQVLFTISGSGLVNNNSTVRFLEAKNNYEKTQQDYERKKELCAEKIISEKALLEVKYLYENAKAVYENLQKNFNASGQQVTSTLNGYIKRILVQNGQFIETGQPLVVIAQNKTLVLHADVQQKYAPLLSTINAANIRTLYNQKTYTFEELNGKVLSYGKDANSNNFLVPVHLQIDNIGSFVSGGFVEIYLKTLTNTKALVIPNTSIIEEQGLFFVFVQNNPELFEKREIQPGATDGVLTEILSGISINERIVTKGAMLIKLAQASGKLDAHSGHAH